MLGKGQYQLRFYIKIEIVCSFEEKLSLSLHDYAQIVQWNKMLFSSDILLETS